jgi:excisionase family DNA binding protein
MTNTSNRLPRLLTVVQVAEHLGVCTKTVRRLIKDGALPRHYVGHQIRITEIDLGIYLAQGKS